MLRASSFLPNAFNAVDSVRLLCWGNVTNEMFDDVPGICFTLDLTKTIQSGERRQQVPLAQNVSFWTLKLISLLSVSVSRNLSIITD